MEDQDSVDQSVETTDTSVGEEVSSQETPNDAEQTVSASEVKQEEKPLPFHEHPRFKEIIEQNRAFKEQISHREQVETQRAQVIEAMQRELQSLRQQAAPKKEEPKDQFLADLEKVNPEYAKSLKSMYDRANKAEEVERRLQQYEQQQYADKAVNHFNQLLESNKISDTLDRKVYERAVRAEVYEREAKGERLGIKDLDSIFKSFHDEYSKAMEARNRKLTADYVKEKSKDKAPKGATGGVPAGTSIKKLAAGDISGQAKWLADQIKAVKKEH